MNDKIPEASRTQFEDENGSICATLWERLSDTPYQVQLEAGEEPVQMALGDIEGLQKYITTTFAGISAILDEEAMQEFNYEARYGMAHYLLDRFMLIIDMVTPLTPEHMAQLEQADLSAALETPNVRSMVHRMRESARILYEPEIDTLPEGDLTNAIYERGAQLLEIYQRDAKNKAIDLEEPLAEDHHQTVIGMIREIAESATTDNGDLEPNDLMRAMWHTIENAFTTQETFSAKEYYDECNVQSVYFESMLDNARTLNPYAANKNHVISDAESHLDEEAMELMRASYQMLSDATFPVQNQETDEIEDRPLTSVPELSPILNQFNMAMHHMLMHKCQGMTGGSKAKLIIHYTDQFLIDINGALAGDPIDARTIENINSTPYTIPDLDAYKAIFSALFGEIDIYSDSEKESKRENLMLRCGEALDVIARHADDDSLLAPIQPDHLKHLNTILAEMAEAIETDDVFDNVELGPIITTVWNVIEEAMYSDQSASEFYETHNIQSEWMQEQHGAAIERSKRMQEDTGATENIDALSFPTHMHFGYKPRRSTIPTEARRKIAWEAEVKADHSNALRVKGNQKLKDEGLEPAILEYKGNALQVALRTISNDDVLHTIVPSAVMEQDFDRIYTQMQEALLERNVDLSKTNSALENTNAFVKIFIHSNFHRVCNMKLEDDGNIPMAYNRAINRALMGNPSPFKQLVDAAYRIGTLRFEPAPYITQDTDGQPQRHIINFASPKEQKDINQAHGELSDAASRYGRLNKFMSIIEEHAPLMFSLLSHAENPKAEMEAKMPILRDLAERLNFPPEPYQNMTSSAAVEIMINAFSQAISPEISADAMRKKYDFDNTAYFDTMIKSNPDLKTRMTQNEGRITSEKDAPYVH